MPHVPPLVFWPTLTAACRYMSKSEWVSMEDSFAQFKELFLKHAVDNPPDAVAMFSAYSSCCHASLHKLTCLHHAVCVQASTKCSR